MVRPPVGWPLEVAQASVGAVQERRARHGGRAMMTINLRKDRTIDCIACGKQHAIDTVCPEMTMALAEALSDEPDIWEYLR